MSGGSMDYLSYKVEDASVYFDDPEIRELIKDIANLMHAKEWADSGDTSDGSYNKTEYEFKQKWFTNHEQTLAKIINDEMDNLYYKLHSCIGNGIHCKDCGYWRGTVSAEYGECWKEGWKPSYLTHGWEKGCKEWRKR